MSTTRRSPAKQARDDRREAAIAKARAAHPKVPARDIVLSWFGIDLIVDVVGVCRYRDTVDDIEAAYTGIEGARG